MGRSWTSLPIGIGFMIIIASAIALAVTFGFYYWSPSDGLAWALRGLFVIALVGLGLLSASSLLAATGTAPPKEYRNVLHGIDLFTEYTGPIFMLISIPLILSNVVEVMMRYVLKDPTIWALDVTTMAFGAIFMLGSAYGLLKGAHVRTDMLWDKFSDQKKGVIDSCAFIFCFLPAMAILCWSSYDDFLYSMSINEKSNSGAWQPIIWPLRAVITLSTGMLFLQGISELLKSLWAARTGEVLVKHEKIEV